MDKTSDARFDAMMEHYRNEMLRYQRATPPGEEPLAEKLNRKEDFTPAADTCHNCIPKDSVPTVKERPLPSDEEEGFTPSPSPKDDEEAVLTSAPMPLRWQIFFPNMPRKKSMSCTRWK